MSRNVYDSYLFPIANELHLSYSVIKFKFTKDLKLNNNMPY